MRIIVDRDGKATPVEVPPGADSVVVGPERYPVLVVRTTPTSVELEIGGERVLVENWPEHFPEPPGPVDVNGERWEVEIQQEAGTTTSTIASRPPAPRNPLPIPSNPLPAGGGTPVVPPMPGKVIELRVSEGARVRKGDVLLVLEAMKMRNEVTSPADGVVRGLRVTAGGNARAREPLLFVAAE